ncbi:MAG: helix-turn-helix transcriptional regulator [Alphaproteobacteria bacterium]|nr:helix-turn-helix transcriptional regulator [Alphaproteobacteria bacterium]
MTQAELAARSGVATPEISKIESGARAAGLVTLEKLARGLQVEPWELLRATPSGEPPAPTDPEQRLAALMAGQPEDVKQRALLVLTALVTPLR